MWQDWPQLRRLAEVGIDLEQVCRKLTNDGLDLFSKALDGLLAAIEKRIAAQRTVAVEERLQTLTQSRNLFVMQREPDVSSAIERLRAGHRIYR